MSGTFCNHGNRIDLCFSCCQAERDAAQAELKEANGLLGRALKRTVDLEDEAVARGLRIATLEAGLREHGAHDYDCPRAEKVSGRCSCRLGALLAPPSGEEG